MPTLAELKLKLEKQEEFTKSLRAKIDTQKAEEELLEKLKTSYSAIEAAIMKAVKEKGLPVKVLDGKYIQMEVSEIGNLNVSLVNQMKTAPKSNGNGNGNGNGHGNGDLFEYFLTDGRGPFDDIQKAMDELKIPQDSRPQHLRYDRLNKELQGKIEKRGKASGVTATPVPDGAEKQETESEKKELVTA